MNGLSVGLSRVKIETSIILSKIWRCIEDVWENDKNEFLIVFLEYICYILSYTKW